MGKQFGRLISAGGVVIAAGLLSGCANDGPNDLSLGGIGLGGTRPSVIGQNTHKLREGIYAGYWLPQADNTKIYATVTISHESNSLFNLNRNEVRADFRADCNTIVTTISPTGLGNIMSTMIGCGEGSFEPILLENLNSDNFSIDNESHFFIGMMQFNWRVPLGEIIPFEGALLDGEYQGTLTEVNSAGGVSVASPRQLGMATLTNGGTLASFYAGCNRLRAPITASGLGPIASTRMACPDESDEQLLLQHLNSGEFIKRSNSSFNIGDITFSKVN